MADSLEYIHIEPKTWVNVYDASGFSVGTQLLIQNTGKSDVLMCVQADQPTDLNAYNAFQPHSYFSNEQGDSGAWAYSVTGTKIQVQEKLGGGTNPDPYWPQVEYYLQMEGVHGSKDFVDSSSRERLIELTPDAIANTYPQIDNNEAAIGSTSMACSSSDIGAYIYTAYDSSLDIGAKDFCIEFWVYFSFLANESRPVGNGGTPSTGSFVWSFNTSRGLCWLYNDVGGYSTLTATTIPTTSTWYHFALSKDGDTVRLFLDGTEEDTVQFTDDVRMPALPHQFGGYSGGNPLSGYLDEVKFTLGVPRYTTDFTPS